MYDYQQRLATEDYRKNWERIWGRLWSDSAEKPLTFDDVESPEPVYPNGCPILEETKAS